MESATCVMLPVCSARVRRERSAPAALQHGENLWHTNIYIQKMQSNTAEELQSNQPVKLKADVDLNVVIYNIIIL